jgi:hypothetical protein
VQVAMLIDELRNPELQVRLGAFRQIEQIAKALGPNRTRDELIPYLGGQCTTTCVRVRAAQRPRRGFSSLSDLTVVGARWIRIASPLHSHIILHHTQHSTLFLSLLNSFFPYYARRFSLFTCVEFLDDDDDVLLVLAEQFGKLIDYVGGVQNLHVLLPPLETLSGVEEVCMGKVVWVEEAEIGGFLVVVAWKQMFFSMGIGRLRAYAFCRCL